MAKNGFTMSNRVVVESIDDAGTGNPANQTTKTLNLLDCGKTFLVNTSGNLAITLPSASNNRDFGIEEGGWNCTFRLTADAATAIDNNMGIQINVKYDNAANSEDLIAGGLLTVGTTPDAGESIFFTSSATSNGLVLYRQSGYGKGSSIHLMTSGDGTWHVDGVLHATGTFASPFTTES